MIVVALIVVLFAIGIGAIGLGIFMFFVQKETKKAAYISVIGILIVIGAMTSNHLRPAYENEVTITVDEKGLTTEKDKNGLYTCKINDPYTLYQYTHEDKKVVEDFCSQFSRGEQYNIKYRFKSGVYTIIEVL